jgi:hypothetical protein
MSGRYFGNCRVVFDAARKAKRKEAEYKEKFDLQEKGCLPNS